MFLILFVTSDLPGSNVCVNLSASEIRRLADRIIANSKSVHDRVASVPLDKVSTSSQLVAHLAISNDIDYLMMQLLLGKNCCFLSLHHYFNEFKTAGHVQECCFPSGRIRGTTLPADAVLLVCEVGVHFR